jgi:hypothetical protein
MDIHSSNFHTENIKMYSCQFVGNLGQNNINKYAHLDKKYLNTNKLILKENLDIRGLVCL